MASAGAWPPRSPHAALLSSPSGRRKFREDPTVMGYTSPRKRLKTGTFAANSRMAEPDLNDEDEDDDDDDDEETLQLKLAAIEAKLKLKKLQSKQNLKHGCNDQLPSANQSSTRNPSPSKRSSRLAATAGDLVMDDIKVLLSPTKRLGPKDERSPGRVLLGIDKGVRGADVSLRRARTVTGSHFKPGTRRTGLDARPTSRLSGHGSSRSLASAPSSHVKSFSERMTEVRDRDKMVEEKKSTVRQSRAPGFKLNEAEINNYRRIAEESSKQTRVQSPNRQRQATEFTREDVLATHPPTSSSMNKLRKSCSSPALRRSPTRTEVDAPARTLDAIPKGDASLYEPFSQLHLSTRILPHSFLKRTLPDETYTRLRVPELLKQVTSPTYELPDSVVGYVVFGILASKSSPFDHKPIPGQAKSTSTTDWERKWENGSQNQKRFMVFQLTDLKWSIDLYLFGTAVPRYHRLTPGTVVALLNPGIMPPKKGKEDTGAFSLTLNSDDDSVLEIGRARDLGFCNATKKDGQECGSWVDSSKTEICEFHLNAQVSKTRASRMGVNAGHNGFAPHNRNSNTPTVEGRGLLPRQEGRRYDATSGSQYFIAASNTSSSSNRPPRTGEVASARLLDLSDDNDDPFIGAGRLSRDKESRLRKRLAAQEKERDIAKRLGALGGGLGGGGVGGEYLRSARRSEQKAPKSSGGNGTQSSTASSMKDSIMDANGGGKGGKRAADSVRLSPVKKKTRFVTEKGVREAGRESLGLQLQGRADEDDGGLEIV